MLPTWSNEHVTIFKKLLTPALGEPTVCSLHTEFSERKDEVSRETRFEIKWRNEDQSSTVFCTKYNFDTPYGERVYAEVHRAMAFVTVCVPFAWCSGHTIVKPAPGVLPSTVGEWVTKIVETVKAVNTEFAAKAVIEEERQRLEKETKKKRVNLGELVGGQEEFKATLRSFEYDCGDKRSCGSLTVTADTPKGELVVELVFGSTGAGEPEELKLTLDGAKAKLGDLDSPDFGVPHFYAGTKAVTKFEENANQLLQEALDEWLTQ